MSSTFIEHSPEVDVDKSLILIMDGEGNVTADPAHFEKLISNQKLPDMGIKIVRLDSSQTENDNDGDSENKPELKLTVEEIYPENLSLTPGDSSVMNSSLEILPGPSNENIGHDMVDPFSQMDPEQLQRLEHALASEQAKQILGENVAAMLDMLSVDDSPAAFLQNSIKNDHCYTNLLPSSDPNGPSFFMNDTRVMNSGECSKKKGKARLGTPIKGRKILTSGTIQGGNLLKHTLIKDGSSASKQVPIKQTSIVDYGTSAGVAHSKSQDEPDDPSYEEDVDVEDSESSVGVDDDNLSDEDYSNRSTRTKKRPRRNRKKVIVRKPGRSLGRTVVKPGARLVGKRSFITPEIRARNEKLNDAMSKVVQSMDSDGKEEDEEEEDTVFKRGLKKMKPFRERGQIVKGQSVGESEKVGGKETTKPVDQVSPQGKAQPPKYPKRENRKPPAHLAEAFGPALFSAPDIIRRISTGDDLSPQLPSEKKNFTVGAHSNTKHQTTSTKVESTTKESPIHMKPLPKTGNKDAVKTVKSVVTNDRITINPDNKEVPESREGNVIVQKLETVTGGLDAAKKANIEIQKLIEKHQVKQTLYDDDRDYSDDNIDDNYYLDPTQMDQSLLEGFAQTASKSEDQLLQEAILLEEQLIESNQGMVLPEGGSSGLEGSSVEMPFGTETIEDIQNEITSAILVAQEDGQQEQKQCFPFVQSPIKNMADNSNVSKSLENSSQNEQMETEEGNLVVDESKPEDRKRNSARRRRSDEVSDLDSDMDDALSEASWNSEDDPDRLWCICRKPHNNRFMICCDVCEEWFHGKCVGITKTLGKQMEQDGLEWSCPNCTKKKKVEEHDRESEKIKLLKEKMAQSIKEQQLKMKESQKLKAQAAGGKDKGIKSPKAGNLKQMKISDFSEAINRGPEEKIVGRKCIMCKGPVRENSIYCSDDCIRKHSQHAISQLMADASKKAGIDGSGGGQNDSQKLAQKLRKEESRIVVMDSNSKKFLVGQNAPTAANLTTWLKENPSYHVVYKKSDKPGKILLTSRKVVKIQSKPGEAQKVFVQTQKVPEPVKSTQLKLAVSPNSKQLNILQPAGSVGGKKIYQIINSTGPGGKQTAFVVKPKQAEVIEALPLPVKTVVTKGVPIKVKEVASPKVLAVGKEAVVQKQDKTPQRKRKDKPQMTGKEGKTPQKAEDGKDKEKDKKDADQLIRDSVKKTLAETLKARVQECKDMEYNEEHIDSLALKIEEKLFKHFENKVDTKYKSKYRSLVFNIKDPKNETLFKKIVDNSISPKELVKLSPDELASQELARWREKENQHQLEMIKKTELELMTKGNTYIMKSHKGEQLIESGEKVATIVAAEIDPNTPAQELVSALNSVTSTTQDANDEAEKNKELETSLMKMKKMEKERRRSRDRKHDRKDRDRKRSSSRSSRSRSHHSKDKKRSRSRDRDKDKSRYRHKSDKKSDKKKEKDSKDEGHESVEDKAEKVDKSEISTSEDTEEKTYRKSVEDDEADREPSSTVIIKTPDTNTEESEPVPLWKGSIVMADVAKFSGIATEMSGDCAGLSYDIGDKVDVVGRIPFATVWDYIARMKKMGTKDILVIKIVAVSEDEKASYATLYNYLSKRSRIGVIGKTSDAVKDFYLYPLASHSPLPQVLLPLEGTTYEGERENTILGIIVRNKHRSRHLGVSSSEVHLSKPVKKSTDEDGLIESVPDRSYTPPLPDKDKETRVKKERQKRKIRVRMDYKGSASGAGSKEAEEDINEDDDSPYSPEDSDEDLPPLPKMAKPVIPSIPDISKLLSSSLTTNADSNLQDASEIQRKIEEMNRAIEEQTQQIQSLTSTVPKLAAGIVLPNIPLLANVTSAILTPSLSPTTGLPGSNSSAGPSATSVQSPVPGTEKVQLPLISSDNEESNEPSRSFTPPLKVEENIPFLPEVTSKISLPSNLQEILNSIQKKSEDSEPGTKDSSNPCVEDIVKAKNPDLDLALNVLNQTKSLINSLSTMSSMGGTRTGDGANESEGKSGESTAILSRLTDQELLRKVKEMEMDMDGNGEAENSSQSSVPCPAQPMPPGVQDIPLLPPNGTFSNPPPPPFFTNPLLSSGPIVEPSFVKSLTETEEKKPEKRMKLDPKSVFESEGVPDFVSASSWDDKKKQKSYKIDIKLAMNTLEKKSIDMDHFDIESISKVSNLMEERHLPSSSGIGSFPLKTALDEAKFDVDERIHPQPGGEREGDKYRGGGGDYERERRRSDGRETRRDWKYEGRRHWDDGRRYKEDYRRHGGGGRRDRPKFRFDDKRNRHGQKEWEGQKWRNQRDERRSRKRDESPAT